SRRRHTISKRDWSSDVCSSDLSYNLVNGRPAHLTDLLESQLRSHLPDPDLLFVVTDAGAPSNLFRAEKVVPDAPNAYAAMLRAEIGRASCRGREWVRWARERCG